EQTTQTFHVEQQVSGTTFEVSGLTAGGLYKVKVKSRCGDKPETIVFFTAGDGSTGNPTGQPTGNCAATSGVTVNSTGTTASINWEPVVGVATYEVEVENEQTTPTFHVEQEVSGTNFEVSGLTAGGLYKVKVKSRCGDKPETIVFFTAGDGSTGNPTGQPTGNCAATSGVTVNSTGTTASINWEPVVGVATYEVEVESEQTTPTFHVEQEVSGTTFEVSGLTAGGLYKVKVKSRCGDKPETVLIFTADDGVTTGSGLDDATGSCAVVEHIRVEPLSGSSVLISWRPAADVNNYELEVELEESDFQQNLNILTSDTSWQIDDLAQGGLYKVQVHSKCTSGGETHSGEVFFIAGMSASVESQPIPDSCFSVSGLLVSPGDPVARITWDAVPGALYYEVEIEAEQTNIPWKLKLFALGSSTEVTGLVSGTAYQVKVKVICSGGTKSLPSIIRFTNGNGLGQAPSTLEVERRTREINNLSLSPNPARHLVHVQVDSPILQDARITLTDFTGRVYYQAIQQVPAGRFDWSVPLEQLGTGIYQVTLQVGNRISVGKLSIFQ
ncbi:MAG: fibronectin type III domain-containing protein, partial [Saprospiraceae bacterium]|nr:fibronectin type III domain-containing protein [Saprospiraceae bacterium]